MRLALAIVFLTALASAQQRTPILLDTDLGDAIDDAFALAFAVHSPEIDLRAVTTVVDDTQQKARLAWKMLSIFNRRDVALGIGAPEPLLATRRPGSSREYDVLTSDDTLPASVQPAATLILSTLRTAPRPITIVAIGPLTNIALALKLDPGIKPHIERIVLMGGTYASAEAEYNIAWDPAAAEIVFQSGVPITALGLEVTKPLVLRDRDLLGLRESTSPASFLLQRLLTLAGEEHPTLYDPLALAILVRPDLVELREGTVSVALDTGITTYSPADRARVVIGSTVQAAAALDLISGRFLPR
jgi:inosine-uridine nucleoside N-ribohydrolase